MKIDTRISPSTITNQPVLLIGSSSVSRPGVTLKSITREADRDREREDERAARELGRDLVPVLALLALLLRRVVRGDRERAEADRERLAERHDAAHDRQAEHAVARHRRVDRPRDLRDLAARGADGDGPVSWAAHHHALEDGLPSDRRCHGRLAGAGRAWRARPARGASGSARPGRRCPSSFCLPV